MKIVIDKDGRKLYKYSHSVSKGGNAYIHKTEQGKIIENKAGLRNVLSAIAAKHKLIDVTIKIYDDIFFFFFHIPRSLAPAKLIDSIQKNIDSFASWDKEYLLTGVYDLQERFIRKDLEKWGYGYEKG